MPAALTLHLASGTVAALVGAGTPLESIDLAEHVRAAREQLARTGTVKGSEKSWRVLRAAHDGRLVLRAGMTKTWGSAADVEAVLPQTLVVYDMGAINHADARWCHASVDANKLTPPAGFRPGRRGVTTHSYRHVHDHDRARDGTPRVARHVFEAISQHVSQQISKI